MLTGNSRASSAPDWGRLFEIAAAQEGHFTTAQAAEAGYYPQLIAKHLKGGRMARVRRGVYRLVHFPAGEREDLVAIWLWAERAGVFSHETALMLHGLSDVLPAVVHLTLPLSWERRRLRVPKGVILHFADFDTSERAWCGAVPVTSVARTLIDCAAARVAPEFVRDAFEQAASRGLIERDAVPSVVAYLKQFYSASRSRSGVRFRVSTRATRRERS
jgi:predicted transcriptional regulator of viral defense system